MNKVSPEALDELLNKAKIESFAQAHKDEYDEKAIEEFNRVAQGMSKGIKQFVSQKSGIDGVEVEEDVELNVEKMLRILGVNAGKYLLLDSPSVYFYLYFFFLI